MYVVFDNIQRTTKTFSACKQLNLDFEFIYKSKFKHQLVKSK